MIEKILVVVFGCSPLIIVGTLFLGDSIMTQLSRVRAEREERQ